MIYFYAQTIMIYFSKAIMTYPHLSVLKNECLEAFQDRPIKIFIDCTLGAAGHAEAFLQTYPEIETFIGIDQDPQGLEIAAGRLSPWKQKIHLIAGNFDNLEIYLKSLNISYVDGILIDLGVSSMQLDQPEKGFSFMRNGPLDMRMNPLEELTAAQIINEWPEEELARIFREYGEEKQWRKAARTVVEARKTKTITTTRELVDVLHPALYRFSKKGIHPLTLVFQALRICVNRELEVIETILPLAIKHLAPGGRLAVITFHSLEDRIVKQAFQHYASDKVDTAGIGGMFIDKEPTVNLITRKPIAASEQEIALNPRSRSAKLRVVEKR